MSLTVNIDGFSGGNRAGTAVQRISRDIGMITGTITFDDSYKEGGEPLTGSDVVDDDSKYTGLENFFYTAGTSSPILQLEMEMPNGYTARLDNSTKNSELLRVYNPHVPPIVFEEAFDADADTATLKYPAAHINYIATEAAPLIPIFAGVTPVTGSVAVAMGYNTTTGVVTYGTQPVLTFKSGEGSATTYCSYITQAWKDVADNMSSCKVVGNGTDMDETWGDGIEWSSDVLDLGDDIVAMTSHTWSNGGTITIPTGILAVGITPGATARFAIDFLDSNDADITYHATDATETDGDIIWVQYIKQPASGFLVERFVNAEITAAADTCEFPGNPLIYGTCGMLPMKTAGKTTKLVTIDDAVASGEGHWTSVAAKPNSISAPEITREAGTDDNCTPAWIQGEIGEIETQAIEVPGYDYSGLGALRFRAIGRIR